MRLGFTSTRTPENKFVSESYTCRLAIKRNLTTMLSLISNFPGLAQLSVTCSRESLK